MQKYNVYNAVNGKTILTNVTDAEFEQWYDRHPFWRHARNMYEVNPDLRDYYRSNQMLTKDRWLVNDEQ